MTYLYFQMPLMLLVITPALDGLKPEWREAAESLGASGAQYWRMVALPGAGAVGAGLLSALLFANAFGTVATVMALTGSTLFHRADRAVRSRSAATCCTTPIWAMRWRLAMIVITVVSNLIYVLLRARAERWQK